MTDDFVQIAVPRQWTPLIYERLAELSREGLAESGELASRSGGKPAPILTEDLVKRMYRESQPAHRKLMQSLSESPDAWIPTGRLAQALGLRHGASGLAGTLGAFGRRANNRYQGLKPWTSRWDEAEKHAEHMMTAEVAEWVRAAMADHA